MREICTARTRSSSSSVVGGSALGAASRAGGRAAGLRGAGRQACRLLAGCRRSVEGRLFVGGDHRLHRGAGRLGRSEIRLRSITKVVTLPVCGSLTAGFRLAGLGWVKGSRVRRKGEGCAPAGTTARWPPRSRRRWRMPPSRRTRPDCGPQGQAAPHRRAGSRSAGRARHRPSFAGAERPVFLADVDLRAGSGGFRVRGAKREPSAFSLCGSLRRRRQQARRKLRHRRFVFLKRADDSRPIDRQGDGDHRPLALAAGNIEGAAMQADQALDQREPRPVPS